MDGAGLHEDFVYGGERGRRICAVGSRTCYFSQCLKRVEENGFVRGCRLMVWLC